MSQDNISDASKPSPGRIYDYFLGGKHNFEVDRQAADQVLKIMPFVAKGVRLQRRVLQDIALELSEKRNYDVIIDFASGLPTMDHIHHQVPKGTIVIYSDVDPVVVEYARDILRDTPDVYFFQGDARRPEELLNHPEVEKILGGRRKVGFVYWGISAFLSDDDVSHAMRYLYEWAAPDSCLAFNAQGVDVNSKDPAVKQILQIYKQLGQNVFLRSLKDYWELIKPWRLDAKGFISLLDWRGFDQSDLSREDVQFFGPLGVGYASYLVHEADNVPVQLFRAVEWEIGAPDTGSIEITLESERVLTLTPHILVSAIIPYINAIADVQHIIDEIHEDRPHEIIIRAIKQYSPISVNLDGPTAGTIGLIRDIVVPWRRKHAATMARLLEQEKKIEIENKRAEIIEKHVHTQKEQEEIIKQREEIEKLRIENEKGRIELCNAKVQLALDILTRVAPNLSETEKISYLIRLLPALDTFISSEYEITTVRKSNFT